MLVSRDKPASGKGIRRKSGTVPPLWGETLPRHTPLAFGLGRRRGREPRVRRPPPSGQSKTEPLAEGGFVFHRLTVAAAFGTALALLLAAPVAAATPHRIVSLSPTATESLFAIGAG